jgi:hypothetical protein
MDLCVTRRAEYKLERDKAQAPGLDLLAVVAWGMVLLSGLSAECKMFKSSAPSLVESAVAQFNDLLNPSYDVPCHSTVELVSYT